jgi:hypothetical protein
MIEPSELYFKAKRWLVLASGSLLLSLTVGLDVSGSSNGLVPIPILDKTKINIVIFVIVLYFIAQFQIHWISQNLEIREKTQFRFDYYTTLGIALMAVISYIFSLVIPVTDALYTQFFEVVVDAKILGANVFDFSFVSSLMAVLSGALAAAISTGAWVKLVKSYLKLYRRRQEESRAAADSGYELLLKQQWMLNFNPRHPNGKKKVTFLENGEIGEGRNHNESKWRMHNEFLELLNDDGKVFSRFKFNSQNNTFFHTNDEDTLSIRDQDLAIVGPQGR